MVTMPASFPTIIATMPLLSCADVAELLVAADKVIEFSTDFAALRSVASLIGRLGQALSGYPPLQYRCHSRARASLRTRHQGPSIMGIRRRSGTIFWSAS